MNSQKIINYMSKHKALFIGITIIAFALFFGILLVIFSIVFKKEATLNTTPEISYPVSNYVVSFTQDTNNQPLSNTDRVELDNQLYKSISSKFQISQIQNCLSSITSQTFSSINLKFDDCKWDANISPNTQISLSAMAIYVHTFLTFTNKATQEKVEIQFNYPGVYEYIGPVALCYSNSDVVTKINGYIYRHDELTENNGELTKISTYTSSSNVVKKGDSDFNTLINTVYDNVYAVSYPDAANKDNAEVCIKRGPLFALNANYSQEEINIFKKFYAYDKDFSPKGILSLIKLSRNSTNASEELLSGFELK